MDFWQDRRQKKRLGFPIFLMGIRQWWLLSKIRGSIKNFAKSPKKHPKKRLALFLCAVLCLPVAATARPDVSEMFDSLLRVILPFYKKSSDSPAQPPTQEVAPSATLSSGEQADETISEFVKNEKNADPELFDSILAEDLSPSGMSGTNSALPNLPSVLWGDSLSAGDVTPMLGEPDLYALMTAEFYADRGEIEQALAIYKAESFKKNATAVFERALSLSIEFEDPAESLQFASAWQAKNSDHIPAWFYVAHLALKAKDYNQASRTLSMILKYDQNVDLTQILTGIVPNNPDDQLALFHALHGVSGDNTAISVLRAGLLMSLGNYPPALLHVNKALNSEPKNLAFIMLKMDILRAMGRDEELQAFIATKRQEIPKEKELYLPEIRQKIDMGDLQGAWELSLVAHARTLDPEVSLLTALLGLDMNEFAKATEILNELVKRPEYASRANYYLGVGYERSGDIDNALRHYQQVKDHENVLDARTKAVGFYLAMGEVDKAMATLQRLRDEYPNYTTDSYILQAEILLRQDKKEEAQALLTKANQESPDDDRLLFASYQLLENELTVEDKRSAIDKLMQIDPYHLEYQLADVKVRLLQNPSDQDALAIAKTISEMDATDPAYDSQVQLDALMVLAEHAYSQGDHQTVLDLLETPYEVAPSLDVGILLLRAYQGLGQSDKVNVLLAELQNRFAFGQNRSGTEAQSY